MSGDGITQLIFFIAAIVIAVGVIGVVSVNVQSISASYGMNSKTLADQLKTDITIINDPATIHMTRVGTLYRYHFYVKNTGKSTIDPSTVNMFINGTYANLNTANWTVMGTNTSLWYPTDVLRLNYTVSSPLNQDGNTIRVVAGNGVFDTMAFGKQ